MTGSGTLRKRSMERILASMDTTRDKIKKIWMVSNQGGSNHSRTSLRKGQISKMLTSQK
jgi:hypothetical protein